MIDHAADDLGIARAICDYAQRLDFYSFVVDVNIAGLDIAVVRVKIDGEWYNIFYRLDATGMTYQVTEIPVAEDGKATHYCFLINDLSYQSFGTFDGFDEKFSLILPLSFEQYEGTEKWNYYFDDYLKKPYCRDTVEDAYDVLLEETKTAFDNGEQIVALCMQTDLVDSLWLMMKESYISDLSEKYGITITGFTSEYSKDAMYVTLEM